MFVFQSRINSEHKASVSIKRQASKILKKKQKSDKEKWWKGVVTEEQAAPLNTVNDKWERKEAEKHFNSCK